MDKNLKVVLIKKNNSMLFPNSIDITNVSVIDMFQKRGKLGSFILFVILRLGIPIHPFFFNRLLTDLGAPLFIVQDADARISFLKWLHKNHPNARIILWYWNTVKEMRRVLNPVAIPPYVEKWSYSRKDCAKYGMHYNTTFYPYQPEHGFVSAVDCNIDVLFVGKDKGRLNKLLALRDQFERYGLIVDFHICPTHLLSGKKKSYSQQISYEEIVGKIRRSRAILDIVVEEDAGPTIRPIEALFWKKKLITDNRDIMSESYYDSNNIFVLGDRNLDEVVDFVQSVYNEKTDAHYYTIEEWIKRFG